MPNTIGHDRDNCLICADRDHVGEYVPLTNRRNVSSMMRLARNRQQRQARLNAELNVDTQDEVVGKPRAIRHEPRQCLKDGRICESCKIGSFEGSKLNYSVIESYSYKPRYVYNKVVNDPFDYFLGVELETDQNGGVSSEIGADMRRPYNFWVPKHDGSVSGPEFASHPATLTWWKAHTDELEEMFTMLLHADFSSHNGNNCGMHVNISRNAFDSPRHLYRFLRLIHGTPRWSIKMAQRTSFSANQWAKLDANPERLKKAAHDEETDKYVAVNVPYERIARADLYDPYSGRTRRRKSRSKMRYEFRLPRGTLRIDRFFKNLEWTVAMIEYTRNKKVTDSTPAKFMKWVQDNDQVYPFLSAFIAEKFEGRVSA